MAPSATTLLWQLGLISDDSLAEAARWGQSLDPQQLRRLDVRDPAQAVHKLQELLEGGDALAIRVTDPDLGKRYNKMAVPGRVVIHDEAGKRHVINTRVAVWNQRQVVVGWAGDEADVELVTENDSYVQFKDENGVSKRFSIFDVELRYESDRPAFLMMRVKPRTTKVEEDDSGS
jgi:hypothetical protein